MAQGRPVIGETRLLNCAGALRALAVATMGTETNMPPRSGALPPAPRRKLLQGAPHGADGVRAGDADEESLHGAALLGTQAENWPRSPNLCRCRPKSANAKHTSANFWHASMGCTRMYHTD